MATHAYRLDVTHPEGSDNPEWVPANWEPAGEDDTFRWPTAHDYLSLSGARVRAALLASYGATVTIRRARIAWEDTVSVDEYEPVPPRPATDIF